MWRALLAEPGARKHLTQFYNDRDFLLDGVGTWVGQGLEKGEGAILLGTKENMEAVFDRLGTTGVDVRGLRQKGRLVTMEVHDFLDGMLESGEPDDACFAAAIEQRLATMRASGATGVRAWGEAGEVLRRRGDLESARVVEEFWNRSIDEHGFSLLCSYHVHILEPSVHKGAMARLTDCHTDLIPHDDYVRLNEAVDDALVRLYGPEAACSLWTKMWSRGVDRANMPLGQSVLMFFSRNHPAQATRLFELTKKYLEASPRTGEPAAAVAGFAE